MTIPATTGQGAPSPTNGVGSGATQSTDPDWTDQVADLVVDTVDKVRSHTTGPVLNIAHGAVYGLVALLIALPVSVVLMVFVVRILNWAIPGDVWIVYSLFTVVAWVAGWILWHRRADRS